MSPLLRPHSTHSLRLPIGLELSLSLSAREAAAVMHKIKARHAVIMQKPSSHQRVRQVTRVTCCAVPYYVLTSATLQMEQKYCVRTHTP